MLVLAHAAHGNALGVPEWLLVSTLVLGTTLTWVALRSSWPAPRLAAAAPGRLLPAWTAPLRTGLVAVTVLAGLLVWGLTLSAGLFAIDEATENLAPFVVNLQLLAGGMALAAVVGDWWRAASPFAAIARLVPDRPGAKTRTGMDRPGDARQLRVARHLLPRGGEPRSAGIWLAAYSIASLAGALAWGRWWATSGEGFAVLFGAIARMAPLARDQATGRLRWRLPLTGLGGGDLPAGAAPACLLAAGGAAFSAVRRLTWWQLDVIGTRSGWDRTVVDTIGLAFVVGVAALVWLTATRTKADAPKPLVPLALGVTVAFMLTDAITRAVDFVALLSDPYGKDWDLLGTADWFPDVRWQTSTRLAWAELAALLLGAVLCVVVGPRRHAGVGEGSSERRAGAPASAGGRYPAGHRRPPDPAPLRTDH